MHVIHSFCYNTLMRKVGCKCQNMDSERTSYAMHTYVVEKIEFIHGDDKIQTKQGK